MKKWNSETFWRFLVMISLGTIFLQTCWTSRDVKEELTKYRIEKDSSKIK